MSSPEPICLTYREFYRELDNLWEGGRLSSQMISCLQLLVASHGRSVQSPEANGYLEGLFRRRLEGGIILSDDRRTVHYDVRVKGSRFKLIRR